MWVEIQQRRACYGCVAFMVACAVALMAAGARAHANALVPPRLAAGQDTRVELPGATARVVLQLLVDSRGHVQSADPVDVEILPTGTDPAPFVRGAEARARSLQFEPALRDQQPVAALVRFEFRSQPEQGAGSGEPPPGAGATAPESDPPPASSAGFAADPALATAPALASDASAGSAPNPPASESDDSSGAGFGARAEVAASARPAAPSAASDLELELGALRAVPRRAAADYLTLAPGVALVNHSGIGHAGGLFLRGFDAGEGQDFELRVDGIPLNEPSNPHGHGYADSQFVIPEVVDRVRVLQGPFDPQQSDFAVAGSANYELGVSERGIRAQLAYGRFAERRALLLWAPSGASRGTFAAVDLRAGDGFGPNRAHTSSSALARYADDSGPLHYSILLGSHALDFDSAGVVRKDDFDARRLACARDRESQFYCVSDPQQGGSASRHLLNGKLEWRRPDRSYELQAYGMLRELRIRENFTGALLDARGDGLDELYEATTVGVRAAYALTPKLWQRRQRLELGLEARHDDGETRALRLRRVSAIPYSTLFDSQIGLTHIGAYVRGELNPLAVFSVRGGARVDAFAFHTLDRAAPEQDREGARLPLLARDAFGSAFSPRGSVVAHLSQGLDWTLSGGLGVRSSDAQALSEGEAAPFARVLSLETGPTLHTTFASEVSIEAHAFAFATRVDNDLLFDAQRGRNVPIGPSNRYGASASARARVGTQHDTLASVTWTEAHRIGPSDSSFAFGEGPRLPFVPRWVLRLDHASNAELELGAERLQLGAAGGVGWVGPQPLPLATQSEARWQVDVALRARLRFLEVGLSVENLLDRRNHAAELNYASHFGDDESPVSMRSVRHFAAGAPRTWMLTLTAYLDELAILQGDDS